MDEGSTKQAASAYLPKARPLRRDTASAPSQSTPEGPASEEVPCNLGEQGFGQQNGGLVTHAVNPATRSTLMAGPSSLLQPSTQCEGWSSWSRSCLPGSLRSNPSLSSGPKRARASSTYKHCSGTFWQIYKDFGNSELPFAQAVAAVERSRPKKRSQRDAPKTFAEHAAETISRLRQKNIVPHGRSCFGGCE